MSVPDPRAVAPSRKLTVPVGVPGNAMTETSAVNVTVCPTAAGLLSADKAVAVGGKITVKT